MNCLCLISQIIISVIGLFSITQYLHMLQQNSYFNSRYLKWLFDSGSNKIIANLICMVIYTLLFVFKLFVVSTVFSFIHLLLVIFLTIMKQKKAIKPLVFTARVKRMYLTYFVLLSALVTVSNVFSYLFNYILLVIALVTSFISMLVIIINSPLESLIRNYYIFDAKKILKNNKNIKVIGVTGSYGKTSTKYILARILQEKFNVLYTPGSFNTTLGVVRTIREMLKPSHEIFICEMGAKNKGDIKQICDIVNPDLAIITSVGPQHLETFKTIENVKTTKFELADAVKNNDGVVYLNFDNEYIKDMAPNYKFVSYSTNEGQLTISNIKGSRFGYSFTIKYKNILIELNTKLLGIHNVLNIAGAVAIALDLGVSERQIKFAVDKLTPVEHRLELKPFIKGSLLIDDAYNSNPSGSAEALNVLNQFEDYRKILVTPGMIELGEVEYDENRKLGQAAAQFGFEIILVGKERSKALVDGIKSVKTYNLDNMMIVSNFKEAMSHLNKVIDNQCVVLFENDLPDNYSK